MSVVWTKEMSEEFLETEPDSMFPCLSQRRLLLTHRNALINNVPFNRVLWDAYWADDAMVAYYRAANERDSYGRCKDLCQNCNCRMLFNQLECVKADLESTKETLQLTSEELHLTKEALEECKAESAEEKRKFTGAIAKMVESEMSDVRTQLNYIQHTFGLHSEKALAEKAASEAAKAALSASKFITLRLLMF
jgi:hypothetical protein